MISRSFIFVRICTIFVCSLVTSAVAAQWYWQNPLPLANSLITIKFQTETSGYAVGACGTIIHTIDAGDTWAIQQSGTSLPLYDIYFSTPTAGYAVGGSEYVPNSPSIITRTADAGENWEVVFSDTLGRLQSVFFSADYKGFASGDNGLFLKTTNSGTTWTKVDLGTTADLYFVYFIDFFTGFVGGSGHTLLKTTDGGLNWNSISGEVPGLYDINDISFPAHDTGYLLVETGDFEGLICKSTDAGDHWSVVKEASDALTNLDFPCPDSGYAAGYSSDYKTTDGGQNWTHLSGGGFLESPRIDFVSATTGYYTMGAEGGCGELPLIMKTADFGDSWEIINDYVTFNNLVDITFPAPDTGYAVGDDYFAAVLLKTTDGIHWNPLLEYSDDTIFSCFDFLDKDFGFIGGFYYFGEPYGAHILKTADGGQTFSMHNLGLSAEIESVSLANHDTGFVTASHSYPNLVWLLRTRDGGNTWETLISDSNISLPKVTFTSSQTGYLLKQVYDYDTSYATLFKSEDAGTTWSNILDLPHEDVKSMFFLNDEVGFLATVYPSLLHRTKNGGATWTTSGLPQSENFYPTNLFFLNADTGFILGASNLLFLTMNGGQSWSLVTTGICPFVLSVWFSSIDSGYACGYMGTIISTKGGGYPPVAIGEIPQEPKQALSNYPNPAKDQTTIEYTLPESGDVAIDIYNSIGVTVQSYTLKNIGKGDQTFHVAASSFPSGVYLYRISSGTWSAAGKMVIQK